MQPSAKLASGVPITAKIMGIAAPPVQAFAFSVLPASIRHKMVSVTTNPSNVHCISFVSFQKCVEFADAGAADLYKISPLSCKLNADLLYCI